MGVAFDITADEAGQAMAEMRAAFRMTQPQVNALADKINYLGNNTARMIGLEPTPPPRSVSEAEAQLKRPVTTQLARS